MSQKIPIPLTLYNYKSSIDMSSETLMLQKPTGQQNRDGKICEQTNCIFMEPNECF